MGVTTITGRVNYCSQFLCLSSDQPVIFTTVINETMEQCLQLKSRLTMAAFSFLHRYLANELIFFSRLLNKQVTGPNAFDKKQVVNKWETAADLVIRREELMKKLEAFERTASRPSRLVNKGKY